MIDVCRRHFCECPLLLRPIGLHSVIVLRLLPKVVHFLASKSNLEQKNVKQTSILLFSSFFLPHCTNGKCNIHCAFFPSSFAIKDSSFQFQRMGYFLGNNLALLVKDFFYELALKKIYSFILRTVFIIHKCVLLFSYS